MGEMKHFSNFKEKVGRSRIDKLTSVSMFWFTMLQRVVLLLLATQMLHITEGAPTLGDELVGNFQKNMDKVHGNLMAGMTNVIKPLADLVDKVPEALLGIYSGEDGIIGKGKEELEDLILGGAGALGSGVKLSSTLLASPLKLAGDSMIAMENMALGKSLDISDRASEHKMNKRDLNNQAQLKEIISSGLRSLQKVMSDQANLGVLRNKKAVPQARVFNTVEELIGEFDGHLDSGMDIITEIIECFSNLAKKL